MNKVYACWENQFEIGLTPEEMYPIANVVTTNFNATVGIEKWFAAGSGFQEAYATTCAYDFTLTAKRTNGDKGNDLLASFFEGRLGEDAYAYIRVNYPSGLKITCKYVVTTKEIGISGEMSKVGGLESSCTSSGAPTFDTSEVEDENE